MLLLELPTELFVVGQYASYQVPKQSGMIHLTRMTQLMYKYIIDEFERQLHEPNIQADGATARATSPPGAGGAEADFAVGKSMLAGKCLQAAAEVGFGLGAQSFECGEFDDLLTFGRFLVDIQWEPHVQFGADEARAAVAGANDQTVCFANQVTVTQHGLLLL